MARWRRSWKSGSSKRARSARQAASTTCCVAERATISDRRRCTSLRTMVVTEATARTAANSTTEGTVDEKSLVVLSASNLVSSCLPMSTCAARAALPTPWSATLKTSWRRAARPDQAQRAGQQSGQVTDAALGPWDGRARRRRTPPLVPAPSSAIRRGYLRLSAETAGPSG